MAIEIDEETLKTIAERSDWGEGIRHVLPLLDTDDTPESEKILAQRELASRLFLAAVDDPAWWDDNSLPRTMILVGPNDAVINEPQGNGYFRRWRCHISGSAGIGKTKREGWDREVVPRLITTQTGDKVRPSSLSTEELFARYLWLGERKEHANSALNGREHPSLPDVARVTDPLMRDVIATGLHQMVREQLAIQQELQKRPDGRDKLFPGMAKIEAQIKAEEKEG